MLLVVEFDILQYSTINICSIVNYECALTSKVKMKMKMKMIY